MKRFLSLVLCIFCTAALAQPYVQAGSSVYGSSLGAAASSGVDMGYTLGAIDSTLGIFHAKQNTPRGDLHWSGIAASTSYSYAGHGSVTAFLGYQISQTPSTSRTQWDGRYGVGVTFHVKPAKVSFTWVPEQQTWDGGTAPRAVGVTVKIRGDL